MSEPRDLIPAGDAYAAATQAAAEFITASKAANTQRAYDADWRHFQSWCADHCDALPARPLTVAAYLADLAKAGRKHATIRRRCAAIGHVHKRAGHADPCSHEGVKATLAGIARQLGTAPVKKAALTVELLAKALKRISGRRKDGTPDLAGLRDRALLALGFAAALRRSELAALDLADVARHPKGMVLTLKRSKTDQAGQGFVKAVPAGRRLHPVAALEAWLAAAKIVAGPVFRGVNGGTVKPGRLCERQVARIVKARVTAIGLDPACFAGHSLRSGFITSADAHGASLKRTADHAGHKKVETTAGYVQVADAFRDHPGRKFL